MPLNASIAPISVPPSQFWDGNDGPWSSFDIHVGTPPQLTRVLVSSTVGETWVISANNTQGGCLSTDSSTCPDKRGGLINVNASSTWQDRGIYELGDETNLQQDYGGPNENGDYGLETLGLGLPGGNGVTLNNVVVAALATKSFYLGNLGVNQQPTNFTTFTDPQTSFLKLLKQQQKIPSLSWAYTAGNQYRLKKVFGSLTLGGYDSSKFTPNTNTFQFAGDQSRDLVVGLQSITYSDSSTSGKSLLNSGILAFVDATVPHIWLPQDACTAFERAFGLTYNSTVNRYLVNDTLHSALQSSNPSVSFILGNDINGGQTVNITLPYAAFDLTMNQPVFNEDVKYFPLRQAANDTQYTLGRTFLQEAYLIVDYERSNFSISQPVFSASATPNLVAINSTNTTSPLTVVHQKGLPVGTIAGIIVAIVLAAIITAVAAFFLLRRHKRTKAAKATTKDDPFDPMAKPEMDGQGKVVPMELHGSEGKAYDGDVKVGSEMEASEGIGAKLRAEMQGSLGGAEMEGGPLVGRRVAEMEGEGDISTPIEMYAGPHGLYEMESPSIQTEAKELPSPSARDSVSLLTPTSTREKRRSSRLSWARRQKPVPQLPGESSTDAASSQDEAGSMRGNTAGGHPRPRRTPLSQSSSDQDGMASPTENSRQRRRKESDALTQRLENRRPSRSNTPKSPFDASSPTTSDTGDDRHDHWNRRFTGSPRNIAEFSQSPVHGSRQGSAFEPSGRRLANLHTGVSRTREAEPSDPAQLVSPINEYEERNRPGAFF